MVNAHVLHCEWLKKWKKCQFQTEHCMTVINEMTGEVDVTAPASSTKPSVSLEYQRLFVHTSLVKSLLSHKRTELDVHANFVSQLNMKSINCVILWRNASDMDMRVVMNVPSVWWHYVLTLALDFIISKRIVLLSINLGRHKTIYNWLCSNIHAWHKILANYNYIYIERENYSWLILVFKDTQRSARGFVYFQVVFIVALWQLIENYVFFIYISVMKIFILTVTE